jgi:threonine synthase
LQKQGRKLTILVATSGDTGGAVANGFFDKENIDVVILYPKGKVSDLQELQLTTFGKNITAIAVDGTFDDCQHLVKTAFADQELKASANLSSANSINIGRLIPQMIYYGYVANTLFKEKNIKSYDCCTERELWKYFCRLICQSELVTQLHVSLQQQTPTM